MSEDSLTRYTEQQNYKIVQFFKVLGERTRKSKKVSASRQENIMKDWISYDVDVVMDSLNKFIEMNTSPTQNEKYVLGIMRNKQKEKEVKTSGRNSKNNSELKKSSTRKGGTDEGGRLQQITSKRKIREEELDCDF